MFATAGVQEASSLHDCVISFGILVFLLPFVLWSLKSLIFIHNWHGLLPEKISSSLIAVKASSLIQCYSLPGAFLFTKPRPLNSFSKHETAFHVLEFVVSLSDSSLMLGWYLLQIDTLIFCLSDCYYAIINQTCAVFIHVETKRACDSYLYIKTDELSEGKKQIEKYRPRRRRRVG
jgi:hypothetical protein